MSNLDSSVEHSSLENRSAEPVAHAVSVHSASINSASINSSPRAAKAGSRKEFSWGTGSADDHSESSSELGSVQQRSRQMLDPGQTPVGRAYPDNFREEVEARPNIGEDESPLSLRPTVLADYIGQSVVRTAIAVACEGARRRDEPLDHVLLHGPPGLGKTSLARLIATELGVQFRATSGPVIERPGDLAAILTALDRHDVLFIDEIHRLPRVVEEVLYSALEDFQIDILIGQGAAARSVQVKLKPFTLVGATTRSGMLTSPLRDRFGIMQRLEFYSAAELEQIVTRSARILECELEPGVAYEIGSRSRGTPRIANRLLRRVRDYGSQQPGSPVTTISLEGARRALRELQIDSLGLDQMDRRILELIIDRFSGGPVGIDTIATAIGEEAETIEDVYEPFLVQSGFIARTRRGREVTARAYEHLGREPRGNS